jgi:hypothetical protein
MKLSKMNQYEKEIPLSQKSRKSRSYALMVMLIVTAVSLLHYIAVKDLYVPCKHAHSKSESANSDDNVMSNELALATTTVSAPSPAPSPLPPGQFMNLRRWKITLPIGRPGKPIEIKQPALATYIEPNYFRMNPNNTAVSFVSFANGTTTPGSKYPRR